MFTKRPVPRKSPNTPGWEYRGKYYDTWDKAQKAYKAFENEPKEDFIDHEAPNVKKLRQKYYDY